MCAWWNKLFRSKEDLPARDEVVLAAQPPRQRPVRRITVGLDFGTSTTKSCFREQAENKPFHVVGHDGLADGDSRVLYPTTVAFDAGRLFFGHSAEHRIASHKIRSFKMCMLCQARAEQGHEGRAVAGSCTNCLRERPGFFRVGEIFLSAEDLSTLYLANVLQVIKERIIQQVDEETAELKINVNSAAPLDQIYKFGTLGGYFDRSLFYAWSLVDRACDGWEIEQAIKDLSESRRVPLPPVEHSSTRVFPETHAAMTAYLLLPQSEAGLYALVDTGAGTTDVAFFYLQKNEDTTKAWYYSAGSKRVGMDDVDHALRRVLVAPDGNLRAARESLSESSLENHAALLTSLAKQVKQHRDKLLFKAMSLDQRRRAWFLGERARYKLFLAGGGSMCKPLMEYVTKSPYQNETKWQDQPACLRIPGSIRVALSDGNVATVQSLQEGAADRLLLLAYGLANPRVDIPKYERDTEGVKIPARDTRHEDLGDHWW